MVRHREDETGAVTAEAAVVLPLLCLVAVALAWLVTVTVTQVRVTDAAREVARGVARGDQQAQAVEVGRRVAPAGSRFEVREGGGTVKVRVSAPVRSPLDFLAFLPRRHVDAEAVALDEDVR